MSAEIHCFCVLQGTFFYVWCKGTQQPIHIVSTTDRSFLRAERLQTPLSEDLWFGRDPAREPLRDLGKSLKQVESGRSGGSVDVFRIPRVLGSMGLGQLGDLDGGFPRPFPLNQPEKGRSANMRAHTHTPFCVSALVLSAYRAG